MKNYSTQKILLLCIVLMIGAEGCKKETLLGTYYCAMHNIAFNPPGYPSHDTIIGYATISIYQSGTQIIINNESLNYSYTNYGTVTYTSSTATPNTEGLYYDNAVFVNSFDSIIYSYNYTKQGVESGTKSSYQGHKIN